MKYQNGQNGFVSLLTTIIISLLLLVITTSLVGVETIQLRKSEDAEQTLRAYYAAEAGVEDAVSKVLSQTIRVGVGDNVCNTNTNYDIPGAAGWTCQQVSFSGSPTGKLTAPDIATTIDPGQVTPLTYASILLEWDQSSDPNAGKYNVPTGGGLPSQAAYAPNYAAAPIELSIVQYPNGGFAANQVCNGNGQPAGCSVTLENALIVPGGGAGGTVNYSTAAAFKANGVFKGNCAPRVATGAAGHLGQSTAYNCYAVLNGFNTGKDFLFRIRSRYMPSAYKMTFYSQAGATGVVVPVPDGTATIDVTAKAGQTYRRVISKLPLSNGAAGGLNFVMYSDTDICKNFDVINNVAQTGCPY